MGIHKNIAIVILAAGASSRMGVPKQLLPWGDTTLLGNAVHTAKASDASAVVVVLGANVASIRKKIHCNDNRVEIIENSFWARGLGSSIACGTDFLIDKKSKPNGILIMLADQPLIDTAYLNEMMAAFHQGQNLIIATTYGNMTGVPALFSKTYYKKLAELDDDYGAKKLLNNQEKNIVVLDVGQRTLDIDTKTDYESIKNELY